MSQIIVEKNPGEAKLTSLGVAGWPIWEKEISTFPWSYSSEETCYLLQGEVTVIPDGGEAVTLSAGDLVVFPSGMSCTWQIRSPVKKHYSFA